MRLIILSIFLLPGPAHACRYISFPIEENIGRAESVFVGYVERTEGVFGSAEGGAAWIKVRAVHKGKARVGQLVKVESREGTCSASFARGEQWLVLAGVTRSGYTTGAPAGSLLLTDDRGLYQRANWEAARKNFSSEELKSLSGDSCTRARFALMDFFDRLPRACEADADCVADQYIDTHACYEPVITNRSRLPAERTNELLKLQRTERGACPLDASRIPACEPLTISKTCRQGRCERKTN